MSAHLAVRAAQVDDLLPEEEETRLRFILDSTYQRVLLEMHHLVADAFELDPASFRLTDEATNAILEQAAQRVIGITETTRNAIRDILVAGQRDGLSTYEIAQHIEHLFTKTWASRGETIARTEIGEAQRLSAIDRYRATGLVDYVRIRDGDEDEPCASRNGTLASLDNPPQLAHPNCLIAGQQVWAAEVETAFTRWFEGEVIVIRTAANDLLTCTPNHPILSGRGWVAAGELTERDHVFRSGDGEGITRLLDPDHDHRPTLIEQIADTLRPAGSGTAITMPGAAIDFHGDGAEGDVHVVWPDCFAGDTTNRQQVQEFAFGLALMSERALLAKRDTAAMRERLLATAHSVVCGDGESLPIRGRGIDIAERSCFVPVANGQATALPSGVQIGEAHAHFTRERYAALASQIAQMQRLDFGVVAPLLRHPAWHDGPIPAVELLAECLGVNADTQGDLAQGLASLVSPTRITQVLRRPFRGHVYNLQTKAGWYVAENIITHNCSLVLIPVVKVDA